MNDKEIKAIIGLGNPGSKFVRNRHNIGFRVVDALADRYGASWQEKGDALVAEIQLNFKKVVLVKPQTFMNNSGRVIPALLKKGITAEQILVVHDELEASFGAIKMRFGGSHRGHNGLRSIIGVIGQDFGRIRFGIGRPENKADVPDYVLHNFQQEQENLVSGLIFDAVDMIENLLV